MSEIHWTTLADFFRFRPDNRPKELLHEKRMTATLGKRKAVLLSCPDLVGRVLGADSPQFPKAQMQYRVGHRAFGPGISGTIGAQNRRQSKVLSPLFSGKQAKLSAQVARDATRDAARAWQDQGRVDLFDAFSRLTLDIVWASLLGPNQYEQPSAEVAAAIDRLHAVPKEDFVEAARIIHALDDAFIDTGRAARLAGDNPFRTAQANGCLSPQEIRANRIVLAASGHLTTALTLSWGIWAIGGTPRLRARVAEALRQGQSLKPFLRAVFSEAMRLWPPGAETTRECARDLDLDGEALPKGTLVVASFYALHRRPDLWDAPDEFRPERFEAGTAPRHPFAFMPFSGGEYRCPGTALAWAELLAIGETLLTDYDLRVDADEAQTVGLTPGTCIYPDRPLWAHVTKRAV